MTEPITGTGAQSEIIEAVKTGNAGRVEALLDADPELATTRGENGESLVLLAAYYGQKPIAKLLIRHGVDVDIFDAAAAGQSVRLARIMESQPELVNAVAPDGFTPLGLAAFFGHGMIVRTLLARGARPDMPSQNALHVTPLHSSVAARQMEIAELLLESGANPNAREQGGFTPLHSAAQNGQVEMAELLLQNGADVNSRADDGQTPLAVALKAGRSEAADMLRRQGGTE